uniref:Uncharacterized protein n=1 Tax=Plectus sambesii TaxID=2011161 RepID=A0A914VN95_9BILA
MCSIFVPLPTSSMVRQRTSEASPLANAKGAAGKGLLGQGARNHARGMVVPKGGFDGPMTAPWRKTVSIFKQPVTLVHTTSRETKQAPADELRKVGGHLRVDKPKQVFWSKHLEGLRAMVPLKNDLIDSEDESIWNHIPDSLSLPSRLEPVVGVVGIDGTAATLCSALQTQQSGSPIMGQASNKKQLDVNAGVFINADQPFIQ